jgi:hypothetical protein
MGNDGLGQEDDEWMRMINEEDHDDSLRSFLSSFTTSGSFDREHHEHHHGDCRCCNVQDSFGNTLGFL